MTQTQGTTPQPQAPHDPQADAKYDVIIVGSGAGGAPLAARLAERGYKVLVLEAGPDHYEEKRTIVDVPGYHGRCTEDPDLSWDFRVKHYAKPDERDPKSDPNGDIFYPRATGVGGCTIHNAMITIAGPPSDWDELAWLLGDPAWSADVMRGYFRRLEDCQYLKPRVRPKTKWQKLLNSLFWAFGHDDDLTVGRHGFDGWLRTSVGDARLGLGDKQLKKMLKAAVLTSIDDGMEAPSRFIGQVLRGEGDEHLDPNHFRRQSERPEGVVLIPCAIYGRSHKDKEDCGRRSSPARRLREVKAQHPDRLEIRTDCLVTQVLFAPPGPQPPRAIGVAYRKGKKLYRACPAPGTAVGDEQQVYVHSNGEVILCGGTFNTPQLLMLSGVGPRDELDKHAIPLRVDSPGVGRNLQDRYEVTVVSQMKEPFNVLSESEFDPTKRDNVIQRWEKDGSGLYASNGAVLGIFKRSKPSLAVPDLFIFGIPLKFHGYSVGYSRVDRKDFDQFTWAILKAHTKNCGGRVTLRSKDPLDTPLINFNYFGSAEEKPRVEDPDLDAIVEGVKFVRRIADKASSVVLREIHPPSVPALVRTDEAIKSWIKSNAWGHHACGTCRMGRATDPNAVIDSRFRVLGARPRGDSAQSRPVVEGLRVVDASIFPNIPGYFIVANVYMASEKAADVIDQALASRGVKKLQRPVGPCKP